MRKKMILAWVLALVMFFSTGLTQLTYAADDNIANGITGGTYTDQDANAQSKYEYTVTGSDGSIATVSVEAEEAKDTDNATETVYTEPEITWARTKDDDTNTVKPLAYVNDSKEITSNNITYAQYTALTWNWSSLEKLINNQEEKQEDVWNYAKNSDIRAASFKTGGNSWTNAAVHKISGEFIWPEGYDLNETTITLESVNDEYYQDIYEYIEDNKLSSFFPEGKVFPVNDDVYAVMWVEDGNTIVTSSNISDYLLFWTGTSGKGIWSQNGNTSADWSRATPATFLTASKQGVRAFHYSWPNAVGVTEGLTNDDVVGMGGEHIEQSDGWYTLTDTTAINSVMRKNYPNGIEAGKKVHLDLYCFNNSDTGGIDELKIVLSKQQETETTVQVQYYYGNVTNTEDTEHYLGGSVLTNQEYGSSISLTAGTKASQLDYMKAAAIVKAGNKDVTSGTQVNNPLVVTRGEDNIIYVLYTAKSAKVVYLNAPSGTIPYDGKSHSLNTVTVTEKDYTSEAESLGNGKYTLPDGNKLENVYSSVTATNPGKYPNDFTMTDGSQPAYIVRDTAQNDVTGTYTFVKTPGTLTITYDPKSVDCTYDFGVNNLYADTLKEVELNAEITENSDEVTVSNADVTYKPAAADTGDSVELTLTFTGNYQVTKTINFIPATNVMYEEDLIKPTTSEQNDWKLVDDKEELDLTTVNDNADSVYGYTESYAMSGSFSNGNAYVADLTLTNGMSTVKTANAAEFTFTGTGFDLISECGTDTGMLVVKVENVLTDSVVKAYLVDTYFTGDVAEEEEENAYITGTGILDYQVPVVRCMDLEYGEYRVTVYGYLVNTAGAAAVAYCMDDEASVATTAMVTNVSADDIVMAALYDLGLEEELDVSDVKVLYMNEDSVLNGGLGNTGAVGSSIAVFASDAENDTTSEESAVTAHVYLDGFRVYKPLKEDATIYTKDGEAGVKYASVYDFIENSVTELEDDYIDNAFVYVEYDGNIETAAISEYKTQGPQNEVYLTPGSGIAFALEGYEDGNVVQLAMKAIKISEAEDLGVTEITSGASIQTATEMYYEVTPEYDSEIKMHVVTVVNNEDSDGILSISGLKISAHIQPMASAEVGEKLIEKLNKSAEDKFVPEHLTVTAKSNAVTAGRNTTLTIESSTKDVAKVAVEVLDSNGELVVELGKELSATNKTAVRKGKAQYYKYSYTFKTKGLNKGKYSLNVYAYDAGDKASAPVTVMIEVK